MRTLRLRLKRRGVVLSCTITMSLATLSIQPCAAQDAILGIYDDATMTQTHGVMDGPSKELWLGVRFLNPVLGDGFSGAEFSIAGLESFSGYQVEFLGDPNVVLGTLAAPADTLTGNGGINVAWPRCVLGETLVAHLTLFAATPPENRTLIIRRKFPPSSPQRPMPFLMPCDIPCWGCIVQVVPGVYVLNPLVGVEGANWTAVRQLFR